MYLPSGVQLGEVKPVFSSVVKALGSEPSGFEIHRLSAPARSLTYTIFLPSGENRGWLSNESPESLDLSSALNELAEFDPAKTRAVELHYFLGCTVEETADVLQVSKSTVERSLRFSLAWLHGRLHRT